MIPKSIKLNKEDDKMIKYISGILKECQSMKKYSAIPTKLVELSNKLAGYYSYLSEQRIFYKAKEAEFYTTNWGDEEGKKLSDKKIEMLYRMTSEGITHYALKNTMRALEKAMKSVGNTTYIFNQESKNQL